MKPKNSFKGKSIISVNDFSKNDIIYILETAKKIENMNKRKKSKLMQGKILSTLFFEPSTRTRLSFEFAMAQLGGNILGFSDAKTSSATKGETVFDTIQMMAKYSSDVIVMRHPLEGSARVASEATKVPVINGGDGSNQHPTQTLLDLYTIKKSQKKISNLRIAMVGDLKYGRTVHSLAIALSHFNCELFFIAPKALQMPSSIKDELDRRRIRYSQHEKIQDVINDVDVLYMTRIQKERFGDPIEYEKVKNVYILNKKMLKNVKKNLRVLHPLPRVNEIDTDVDDTPYAYYFEQAKSGIPVRQALLTLTTGVLK